NLALGLKEAKIEDMACFTGSDHNAPVAEQKDWERYRVELYKRITRVGKALEKGILETAMKHILKKKICKTKVARDGKKRPRLDKLIIELGRWVRKGKRKIGKDMTKEDKKNFGLFRKNIRKKFQIKIENISEKWEDKNIEDLSGWWKILFNKNSNRIEKKKLKQIEWCIERQWQMIDGEQGRMLASLLKKPFNHVVVDKLLENQNNIRVLICDPEKVKEKTKKFSQKQFRRRCFDSDALRREWAQVYALLERVKRNGLKL
ncbi:45675_t:CDS:2, partial [Gigaspora margarita]